MTPIPYVSGQSAPMVHTSLQQSLKAMNQARKCSILWFAEIMNRHLYRELGHSSINQYAMIELGFSKSRTGDFIRLARQLDKLPVVRQALATGDLGYTKAREIVSVATPDTQDRWLEAAKRTRNELIREVKKVKRAAKVDPRQEELLPARPLVVSPREVPVRFQVDLSPEQEARRAALVERLHKLGAAPTDRAELMLEALAALVEVSEGEKAPRGALGSRPPVQIHVHETEGKIVLQTGSGERELGRADAERMRCDAAVCRSGARNTTTIPPRTRLEVMARDRHSCQAAGCERTRFLEVHHLIPRSRGGGNNPDNLVTLCGACHRLWHERRGLGLRDFLKPAR